MRKILFSLLVILSVMALFRTKTNILDGFALSKIVFSTCGSLKSSFSTQDNPKEILSILGQKFFYLGKGRQAFVFESKDKKYVIKILRKDRLCYPIWIKWFPFFSHFQKKIKKQKDNKHTSWVNSFSLANTYAKNETGIVYCHLTTSCDLNQKITLVDLLNREHRISADNLLFMVQKKTIPMENLLLKGKIFPKKMIDAFFDTIVSRMEKNLVNKTRRCIYNIGYLDGKAIEYDVGEWAVDNNLSYPEEFEKEINRYTTHLQRWMEKNTPDSIDYFETQKRKAIDEAYKKRS